MFQLNDKDAGYLEERIKRTGKKDSDPPVKGGPKIAKGEQVAGGDGAGGGKVVKGRQQVPVEVCSQEEMEARNNNSNLAGGTYKVQRRGQANRYVQSVVT